jgi:hypothetical protein
MNDKLALSEYDGAALYIDKQGIPWMTQRQIGDWLGLDQSTVSRIVRSAIANKAVHEVSNQYKISVYAKYTSTALDGKNYRVNFYNMFVIIMVAMRVNNSEKALKFQVWALRILGDATVSNLRIYIKSLEIELGDLAQRHYDAEDEAYWARLSTKQAEARARVAEKAAEHAEFLARTAEQETNEIKQALRKILYGDLDEQD